MRTEPMRVRWTLGFILAAGLLGGCVTVEPGFRYDFEGRVYRADGKTPVKGAEVWVGRPDAPPPPAMPAGRAREAANYIDKSSRTRTDSNGRFVGNLQTVKGWRYTEFNGIHTGGPRQAPVPPELGKVYVYVQERDAKPMGYELEVPAASQAEAISGVRKMRLPDLLIPDKPATAEAP